MGTPGPTNRCPNVQLSSVCNGPTDEVFGTNCMALVSSPCAVGSVGFSESLGLDPSSSADLPSDTSDESSALQSELNALYMDVDAGDTTKIRLICDMLGLRQDGQPIGPNDALPLSKEFNGCNKSVIDSLRERCLVHEVPLIQCNLSHLNNLWERCKTANENDTKTFDTDICPHLIKNDDNYALNFIKDHYNMTSQERFNAFSNDESLRKAWESDYILKKMPGTVSKFNRDAEIEEEDASYGDKYFDELDVMQNCVLYDYTNSRHRRENQRILDFYRNNGLYYEFSEDGQKIIHNINNFPDSNDGKFVNRFCDYGSPRPPSFYNYENPLTIPDSQTILDGMDRKIIDNDDKRFSVYSGTYKCPEGTIIGDDPDNPYLNFENPDHEGKNCNGVGCGSSSNPECLLQSKYHPELEVDKQLSEEDSQCYDHTKGEHNTALCPDDSNADCSDCEPRSGQRAFWNSHNCKLRPINEDNIYGHSCEDNYAACVRYETPEELKRLKNQFLGKLRRDNVAYSEYGCRCSTPDCTEVIGSGCGSLGNSIINTNLTYPELKGHNFLTDDMIEDRKNLFDTLNNPDEPIYKCMRCGLRNTNTTSSKPNSSLHIYNSDTVTHSRHPDFLLFKTDIGPGRDGSDKVTNTNCTSNDMFWYQNEKGFLETRLHQDRTLREVENSISVYQDAIEESEENIRISAANYEIERRKRREEIDALKSKFQRLQPRVATLISAAEQAVADEYASKDEELPDSDDHNYLFYIMGFIIFVILILFLVF